MLRFSTFLGRTIKYLPSNGHTIQRHLNIVLLILWIRSIQPFEHCFYWSYESKAHSHSNNGILTSQRMYGILDYQSNKFLIQVYQHFKWVNNIVHLQSIWCETKLKCWPLRMFFGKRLWDHLILILFYRRIYYFSQFIIQYI